MSTDATRMLKARAQVMLRIHERMMEQPLLLEKYGSTLALSEQWALRRCLAQSVEGPWVDALHRAVRELEERGISIGRSLPKKLLDRSLGLWSERLALAYLRRCEPEHYAYYAKF
jgi:hypothetical protein